MTLLSGGNSYYFGKMIQFFFVLAFVVFMMVALGLKLLIKGQPASGCGCGSKSDSSCSTSAHQTEGVDHVHSTTDCVSCTEAKVCANHLSD